MPKFFKNFTKTDQRILFAAVVLMLVCLFLLSPYGDDLMFGDYAINSKATELGKISYLSNDTRHKRSGQLFWAPAKEHRIVRSGESIFAGQKSSLNVDLNDGSKVMIGENSLVTFQSIAKERMANLNYGNFNVKVNGNMKIAIQGEVTNINGQNSEIQVFIGTDKKPKIKLLKGEATIKNKKSNDTITLKPRAIASLPTAKKDKGDTGLQEKIIEIPIPPPVPEVSQLTESTTYIWKLYDLYESKDKQILEKKYRPLRVKAGVLINQTQLSLNSVMLEVSSGPNFIEKVSFKTSETSHLIKESYIGENYWRTSFDNQNWSKTQKYNLLAKFLDDTEPTVTSPSFEIPLIGSITKTPISLSTKVEKPLGFIVQASTTANFSPESTKVFWSAQSTILLSFFKSGAYFYRFKTVSPNQELSIWSKSVQFNVFAPEAPPPPRLVKGKSKGEPGESFKMIWKSDGLKTRIEITDKKGNKVQDIVGEKPVWKAKSAGEFAARAWTVNQYGQESVASKPFSIKVSAPPVVVKSNPEEKPRTPKQKEPERKTASVESSNTIKAEKPEPSILNDKYKSSLLSVNGFMWTLFSSEQYYGGDTSPIASGLGIHGYYWKDHHGFEGSFKSGAVGLNKAGESQSSLKDVEARYHYRFFTGSPWGYSRELQISLFGGLELYRNSGGTFVSGYDLVKFGTAIEFPLGSKWMTGGEFVFGLGADNTQKKEVSGNINYFMAPNWSIGAGYRIHLYDAGSLSATPRNTLPYREGYTEGFSVLNYHY